MLAKVDPTALAATATATIMEFDLVFAEVAIVKVNMAV